MSKVYLLTDGNDCPDCGEARIYGVYATRESAERQRDDSVARQIEGFVRGWARSGQPTDVRATAKLRAELMADYEITEQDVRP